MERISKNIKELLFAQISEEFNSSMLYQSISEWAKYEGYFGIAKLYDKYAKEELEHMEKIMDYLQKRDIKAITPTSTLIKTDFNVKDVVLKTIEHEIYITDKWKNISLASLKDNDFNTFSIAQWFMTEQIEEENKAFDLRNKLDKTGLDTIGIQLFDDFCNKKAE